MKLDPNIDLIGMAIAVYQASVPKGYGYMQDWQEALTRQQVIGQIYKEQPHLFTIDDSKGNLFMDYVRGHQCKCWVSNWSFDTREYDDVHGQDAAQRLIANVGTRKCRTEITLTGSSVEDAKSKIHEYVQMGCPCYVWTIDTSDPKVSKGMSFKSVVEALQEARSKIPTDAEVLKEDVKETIYKKHIYVAARNLKDASSFAARNLKDARYERILDVSFHRPLRKFLGLFKIWDSYKVTYHSHSIQDAQVTFRLPAKIGLCYESID